ncbi:hypothetical protein NECAME_09860 [Necator americanus]|uniref:STAS domain-containing protein n=1 Tax=Necator americanus TaxID=51031 RepID=W2TED9_NECAM|nr:hypothetical protein NECAME_09860 [Necator americanus]ETN79362.1 hypothetical protein NECAME_09860 [Necator americanus]
MKLRYISFESSVPPPDSTVLRFIILDCTGMAYVDPEALAMLSQIYSDLRTDNIKLLFSGVNCNVSMNGYRDVIALSTTPSHQDLLYRLSPEPV